MPAGLAPELDDEVAEAVEYGRVLREVRGAVDVADDSQPLGEAATLSTSRLNEARIERAVSRAAW